MLVVGSNSHWGKKHTPTNTYTHTHTHKHSCPVGTHISSERFEGRSWETGAGRRQSLPGARGCLRTLGRLLDGSQQMTCFL